VLREGWLDLLIEGLVGDLKQRTTAAT
jgi:hypothetical protein